MTKILSSICLVTFAACLPALAAISMAPADQPLSLWRLDCGSVFVPNVDFLNDTFALSGRSKTVSVSCYVIRDGSRYMLWDTGLPTSRLGKGSISVGGGRAVLSKTVLTQLAELKIDPRRIEIVALSHYHSDHSGQAATLPWATLVIGAQDMAVVRGQSPAFNLDRSEFAPWLAGHGNVEEIVGDHDVFGDKRVIMLATPGHTPGHHSLLVRLATGSVILTGDLWHFREQVALHGVPTINVSRADSLASMDRISRIARVLRARIIIGHDTKDINALPIFPAAAH